jgi:DNA repair exonuclease SbcCD nuclease subunit
MRPEIRGDAKASLRYAVDYCVSNGFSLKLAGDTFDSTSPTSDDVNAFRVEIDKMQAAGLPVYAIQGQHDKASPPWFGAVHPHVQHVHGKVFEPAVGIRMMAFDYMSAGDIEAAVAEIPPDVKWVMLHQAARPVLDIPGAWNFDPAWLPPWVKIAIMGDIHKAEEFTFGDGSKGIYPGSAHMLSTDEQWQKSMLLEEAVGDSVRITRIPLPSRRYVEAIVLNPEDLKAACAAVREEGKDDTIPPVFIVKHSGVDGVASALADAAAARVGAGRCKACVWLTPYGGSRSGAVDAGGDIVADESIPSVLTRCTTNAAVYSFTLDLLSRDNTAEVIREARDKAGVVP